MPFSVIVAAAAAIGFLGGVAGHPAFRRAAGHGGAGGTHLRDEHSLLGAGVPPPARRHPGLAVTAVALLVLLPVGLPAIADAGVFDEIATFFATMAVVTFGGAYAVLADVAQEAVGTFGRLQPVEMLDGLGMVEAVVRVDPQPGLWFAMHVLFTDVQTVGHGLALQVPVASSLDPAAGLVGCRADRGIVAPVRHITVLGEAAAAGVLMYPTGLR